MCWFGHDTAIQMDRQRIPQQALHWEVPGFKRGPGRPRTNWRSTVNKDLLRMGITWEEVEVGAQNTQHIRMASECDPMHPLGCGLNQGQVFEVKIKAYYEILHYIHITHAHL